MQTLLITPAFQAVSETFIMRHVQILRDLNHLSAIVVMARTKDHYWDNIPLFSLGNRRLRPKYDRVWRSLGRRMNIKFSSWYPASETLTKLIQEEKFEFDIVLIEYSSTAYNLYGVVEHWLKIGKRILIHLHGYDAVAESFAEDYVPKLRILANLGAVFIANSEFTASTIAIWQLPPSQLIIKTYGIDIPERTREHHNSHKVTILHLGRLVDFKAPHLTIKAFERACELGLDGNLIIAGDGEMRATCETIWQKSKWKDRITLLGAVDWDKAEELRCSADIFTLHSVIGEKSGRVENLGVAILEAMVVELPVVTCAMGGIKETVVDGETGIFFPTTDVEAQANAFLMLARNPELRQKLGAQGRARVIEHFSIEREKRELLRLLGYTDE